jgi:hypothetical protein
MDSMSGAVSLARALLALTRFGRSGVLHTRTELGTCRLSIARGVLAAAAGSPAPDDILGDALMRAGALDVRAHGEAMLRACSERRPIGDWLVDTGLTTRPAVEVALRGQLRDRVLRVLACRDIEYCFEAGHAEVGAPSIEEPVPIADLVLSAMRTRVDGWSPARMANVIGRAELRLNAAGHALTREVALWPEERVAVALLSRGTNLEHLIQQTRGAPRGLRFAAVLTMLSALRAEPLRERRFSLLLRKREQLRRKVGARAMLDLHADAAPIDARRALRRLARRVHPDALGPHAAKALRASASEVMVALIDAERALRMSSTGR